MVAGCATASIDRSPGHSPISPIEAHDVSRVEMHVLSDRGLKVSLEARIDEAGRATLAAVELYLSADPRSDTVRADLSPEEWSALVKVAIAEEVLDWKPRKAPLPLFDDGASEFSVVGGREWTLQVYRTAYGVPDIGFKRLAERLMALARLHDLRSEDDHWPWTEDTSSDSLLSRAADPADLRSIAVRAFPHRRDAISFARIDPPIGEHIAVFSPKDDLYFSVGYRHASDSHIRHATERTVSRAEWDSLVQVVKNERLLEWLPLPRELNSSDGSPAYFGLRLTAPGGSRVVTVPATGAGPLPDLIRQIVGLADSASKSKLHFFRSGLSAVEEP